MLLQNLASELLDKFLEQSFRNFGTEIDLFDVVLVLFWSIFLSVIVAITYRGTHRGVSYSQSFTQTLVMIGMTVSIVMLIIGTNIARAFTLVGALSVVRFRNAVKDTRDVGFIFFVMVIGMAVGTRFYPIAIITTFVGCGLIYYMTYTQFGQKRLSQDVLEMHFPTTQDYAQVLSPIFVKYLKYYSLLGVDSLNEKENRLSFIVTFKQKKQQSKLVTLVKGRPYGRVPDFDAFTPKSQLLKAVQELEGVTHVKVIEGSSSIEI